MLWCHKGPGPDGTRKAEIEEYSMMLIRYAINLRNNKSNGFQSKSIETIEFQFN